MIKEIFEIEPRQKNLLIILFAITSLSFLQIYLFSPSTFDKGAFTVIGLSLALMVCQSIMYFLPSTLLLFATVDDFLDEDPDTDKKRIFMLGLFQIALIVLVTYIAFEIGCSFRNFIRASIASAVLQSIIWIIVGIIIDRRDSKKSNK